MRALENNPLCAVSMIQMRASRMFRELIDKRNINIRCGSFLVSDETKTTVGTGDIDKRRTVDEVQGGSPMSMLVMFQKETMGTLLDIIQYMKNEVLERRNGEDP